ncbi:MAG: HypC/HybG/HupF family hydrogenase formation chaperone [Thermodesulfobacteriota bacterium]
MCLAKPVKIINLRGDWAEVDGDGGTRRAWCALLTGKGLRAGDYLLVHGDLAIHKIPEDEALRIIELVHRDSS